MVATLLTGSAGAGKTLAAIRRAEASIRHDPFSTIWVLLPTDLQIANFRARLLAELGSNVCFGVEAFDFYTLYQRLLRIAGEPQRRVTDTARFRVLRHVLDGLQPDLTHFAGICQTPGFVRIAANFIQELKQARIEPESFQRTAQTDKDRDLALIYNSYQHFLRSEGLVDSEGEGWLALAELERQPDLDLGVSLLIVDGFDQFNIVQAELLGLLTRRIKNTVLTLTFEPERAQTAHRRYAQTRQRLFQYCREWDEQPLELPTSQKIWRGECLHHLTQSIFESTPAKKDHDGTISLIEVPDPRREVEYVLRQVKSSLLKGAQPDDMAILARDLSVYAIYFLELASSYGVPIATRLGAPLGENPAVANLLALIDTATGDFRRRAVMDALHSPYLACPDLNGTAVDLLERISRTQLVTVGRDSWFDAIARSAIPLQREDDNEAESILDIDTADQLTVALDSFFTRITPPESGTARDYVRWIEGLIGPDPAAISDADAVITADALSHFGMISQIRAGESIDPAIPARDLAAFACFKTVLHDMLSAYELIDAYETINWEQFRTELAIAVDNTTIKPKRDQSRVGRVLVSSVYEARGLAHDMVFLLGLSEGSFPARAAEDALYHDSERLTLKDSGLALLTRAEEADESSLFYEVTALARHSLILTRPYTEKGDLWPESPYWRAVLNVIDAPVKRVPLGEAATLDKAARLSEVVVAVAQNLNERQAELSTLGAHAWLNAHPEHAARWQNALLGRQIELQREKSGVGRHAGLLEYGQMIEAVGDALGPARVWSASQFNEYGLCPFKFFARRLLKLNPLAEPEDGLTPAQSGTLIHKILEITYGRCAELGLTITPENQTTALTILETVMADQFPGAPAKYGFVAGAVWQQEQASIRRWLYDLIALDFSAKSPVAELLGGERRPLGQEAGFGDGVQVIIDGDAGPIRAQGSIDRMDAADGRVLVLDYKSGSTPFKIEDMTAGRNVQMLIYILAARRLVQDSRLEIIGGAFWHIKKHKLSGEVQLTEHTELIEAAQAQIHANVMAARRGEFPNTPGKAIHGKCVDYCEYSQLCRARIDSV